MFPSHDPDAFILVVFTLVKVVNVPIFPITVPLALMFEPVIFWVTTNEPVIEASPK